MPVSSVTRLGYESDKQYSLAENLDRPLQVDRYSVFRIWIAATQIANEHENDIRFRVGLRILIRMLRDVRGVFRLLDFQRAVKSTRLIVVDRDVIPVCWKWLIPKRNFFSPMI
ncbi:MAG: hypothetical protein ACI814_003016 [Mariniblastus sp.]